MKPQSNALLGVAGALALVFSLRHGGYAQGEGDGEQGGDGQIDTLVVFGWTVSHRLRVGATAGSFVAHCRGAATRAA